jgi:hypothetical protein
MFKSQSNRLTNKVKDLKKRLTYSEQTDYYQENRYIYSMTPIAEQFANECFEKVESRLDPITNSLMLAQLRVKCNILWTPANIQGNDKMLEPEIRMRYIILLFCFIVSPPLQLLGTLLYELTTELEKTPLSEDFDTYFNILQLHLRTYKNRIAKIAFSIATFDESDQLSKITMNSRLLKASNLSQPSSDEEATSIVCHYFNRLHQLFKADKIPKSFFSFITNPRCTNSVLIKDLQIGVLLPMTLFTESMVTYGSQFVDEDIRATTLPPDTKNLLRERSSKVSTYVCATIEQMHSEAARLESLAEIPGFSYRRSQTLELPSPNEILALAKAQQQSEIELPGDTPLTSDTIQIRCRRVIEEQIKVNVLSPDVPEPLYIKKVRQVQKRRRNQTQELGVVFLDFLIYKAKELQILDMVKYYVPPHTDHFLRFKVDDLSEQVVELRQVQDTDVVMSVSNHPQAQRFVVTFDPLQKTPVFNAIDDPFNLFMDIKPE